MERDVVKLRQEQGQDEAACMKWLLEASNADLLLVWDDIQRMGDLDNSRAKVVARFAQLGMTHAILLSGRFEEC